jgi:hypothetical protein
MCSYCCSLDRFSEYLGTYRTSLEGWEEVKELQTFIEKDEFIITILVSSWLSPNLQKWVKSL